MNYVGIWTVFRQTHIRDFVDQFRVWESHADPEIRRVSKPGPDPIYPAYIVVDSDTGVEDIRVVAVTKPKSTPDQLENFFPTTAGECSCPDTSSGSGGSGNGEVVTESGGGNPDSPA